MSPSSVAENSSVWRVVRGQVEQPLHLGQEAHVGHPVGLVDHHDLHRIESDAPPLDEVTQASRAGHGHVHATGQGLQLGSVPHPAVERVDPQGPRRGQDPEFGGHLGGQLAGGGEHEDPGVLRPGRLAP